MRIMIIGSGGAGKSTLAREMGQLLKLPVHHLDLHYWQPGWQAAPAHEWSEFLKKLVVEPEWIIDGNYGRTMDIRMEKADVIIFMDVSPWVAICRVFKRRLQYHGRSRPDLNAGCPERIDWEFVKYVGNFRKNKRPEIRQKLQEIVGAMIVIIRNSKEKKAFLKALSLEGADYFLHNQDTQESKTGGY